MLEVQQFLHTSLKRADLFEWMERVQREHSGQPVRVDTWEITDHPGPDGTRFTLYAATMVYVMHISGSPIASEHRNIAAFRA